MRKCKNGIFIPVERQIRRGILAAALAFVSMNADAQYDPYFSHYFDMQPSFNPAAAGKETKLNITGTYAMSMAGFENAPQTAFISGDMPFVAFRNMHGAGLQLMNDKLGLFSHQRISLQYAFRKKLGNGYMSVGIQPGIVTEKFEGSSVDLDDESDPVFSKSDIDGNTFDLAAGIYYAGRNWYAGISAQHLTSPTVLLGETNEMNIDATYYATGGMDFQLRNPKLKICTSALVRTDGVAYRGDITGRMMYTHEGKMFYAGATYSPTNSVTALVGGNFKGVLIAYSFEIYTNGISFRNGSHELFVGYQMDIDLGKKGKNRHQTTRTL